MTGDRHTRSGETPDKEAELMMDAFRAARTRMVADQGMAERIAALADKTDHAICQAQPAIRDLDRAVAILSLLGTALVTARLLARLVSEAADDRRGRRRLPQDVQKQFASLCEDIARRSDEAKHAVDLLEDNLDVALTRPPDADEFTRARAIRHATLEARRGQSLACDSAVGLASSLDSDHAQAARLREDMSPFCGVHGKMAEVVTAGIDRLEETLAAARCGAVELTVGIADGDLSGWDLGSLDVSGADLARVNLSGALFDGVRWSDETRWPPGKERWIRARSEPVGQGTYQVVGPAPDRGLGSGSLQA